MTDVIVVGAGPVGLALALGLARDGREVLVLEQEPRTAEHSRAPAIWPRTQEVLDALGVARAFLDAGIVVPTLELFDADRGRALLRVPFESVEDTTRFPHLLILPQSQTEALLLAAVRARPNAEVRFSNRLSGFRSQGSSVVVRVDGPDGPSTTEAAFLAGCDGAHSTVREGIGAGFDGQTYTMRAALADIRMEGTDDLSFPRITTRPRMAVGIRIDHDLWRLILPVLGGPDLPLHGRVEDAVASLFGARSRTDVWRSEFRLHRRVASTFQRGRVVLAGDAAHLNSPVGGQGMNAGIQDTELLVPALGRALDRRDPAPLAEYGRIRREAVRTGVNRLTDIATRLLMLGDGRMLRPLLTGLDAAMRVAPLRRRVARSLAMLG